MGIPTAGLAPQRGGVRSSSGGARSIINSPALAWGSEAGVAVKAESRVVKNANALPCVCFVAGTKVQTEKGEVPVENMRPGDEVWAKNLTTGKNELRPVTGLFRKSTTVITGIRVENRAYTLDNGTINIGTYYVR